MVPPGLVLHPGCPKSIHPFLIISLIYYYENFMQTYNDFVHIHLHPPLTISFWNPLACLPPKFMCCPFLYPTESNKCCPYVLGFGVIH